MENILIKARRDVWKGEMKKSNKNPIQFSEIITDSLDFLNLHFVSNNCESLL